MPKRVGLDQAGHITGRGQEAILRPASEFQEEVRELERLEQGAQMQHGASAHLRKSSNAQMVAKTDRSIFSKLSCRLPSRVLDGIDDFRRLIRDHAGSPATREEVVEAILRLAIDNQENELFLDQLSSEVGRVKGLDKTREPADLLK